MKIIRPSYEIKKLDTEDIPIIEEAARCCYKSEGNIREGSSEKIIQLLINKGHESVLEHSRITVKFTVDRGVSHEMVRHRLASYSQESTRYCNYSNDKFGNEITVIEPWFYHGIPEKEKELCRRALTDPFDQEAAKFIEDILDLHRRYARWYDACLTAEKEYFNLLNLGATPQEARNVLPNSLKTEMFVTANFREWRHILELRTSMAAHPQIREVMIPLLKELQEKVPIIFYDISFTDQSDS